MAILKTNSQQAKQGGPSMVQERKMVLALSKTNTKKQVRGRPSKVKETEQVLASTKTNTKKLVSHSAAKYESYKRKRAAINDKVESKAMMIAKSIEANLSPKSPSCIKYMLPSHVTGGFWLGLCKQFCTKHLPTVDTTIVLEDESGKSSATKYLAEKRGLSCGWRGFSINHNLVEGDVLVFHLVEPTKFKVYIVRAKSSEEVDGAPALMKLDKKPFIIGTHHVETSEEKFQDLEHLSLNNPGGYNQEEKTMACGTNLGLILGNSNDESEDFGFEVTDGIRMMLGGVVDFKDVKCFDDFDIIVDGWVVNCELSKHEQRKYYELCCSQKRFLHENLLQGLNCKLIAGVISETINITDAIRASKLSTSYDDFIIWEKTLKNFQVIGMKVDFLIARLEQLMVLAAKSQRYKKLLEGKQKVNGLDVDSHFCYHISLIVCP